MDKYDNRPKYPELVAIHQLLYTIILLTYIIYYVIVLLQLCQPFAPHFCSKMEAITLLKIIQMYKIYLKF